MILRKSILPIFVRVLLSVLVIFKILIPALHTSLHEDESLYIGAAVKMLSGDILLQDYWFDKPIFLPLWIIPGIILLKGTFLGFKLSALILSVVSFLKLSYQSISRSTWASLVVALVFFTNPYTLSYLGSSLGEPFLLFCFVMFVQYAIRSIEDHHHESTAFIWFAIAICTKQSALMWAPMFLVFVMRRGLSVQSFMTVIKEFFKSSKYVWLIALLYQITNKQKFAAISWFSNLTKPKVEYSLFQHLSYWSETFLEIQRTPVLAVVQCLIFITYVIIIVKKLKSAPISFKVTSTKEVQFDLFFILIPVILHFLGVVFSNAGHYERYLFIFNVQFVLIMLRLLYHLGKYSYPIAITALLICSYINVLKDPEKLIKNADQGTLVVLSKDLIADDALVHTKVKWKIFPNDFNYIIDPCVNADCFQYRARGLPIDHPHYSFGLDEEFSLTRLFTPGQTLSSKTVQTEFDIWNKIQKELKIPKNMILFSKDKIRSLVPNENFSILENSEVWSVEFKNDTFSIKLNLIPLISSGDLERGDGIPEQRFFSIFIRSAQLIYSDKVYDIHGLINVLHRRNLFIIDLLPIEASEFSPRHISIETPNTYTVQGVDLKHL